MARRVVHGSAPLRGPQGRGRGGRPSLCHAPRSPGLAELPLEGLGRDVAKQLLLDHTARPIAELVVERIVTATAGNPLALMEIPGFLTDAQLGGAEPLPDPP